MKKNYAFLQVNTFGKILEINSDNFKKYKTLIETLSKMQELWHAYKNVQIQYKVVANIPKKYDKGEIDPTLIFTLADSFVTSYIIMHRNFLDNCKSFQKNNKNLTLSHFIQVLENNDAQKNMKVLRDFAIHTSIPITRRSFVTHINYHSDISKRFHTILDMKIEANSMDKKYLSKFDIQCINHWQNGKLEIIPEINTAWNQLKNFTKEVFKDFIDVNIPATLQDQVDIDKQLWQEILLKYKTCGVSCYDDTGISMAHAFIDYDLLNYCINCILD